MREYQALPDLTNADNWPAGKHSYSQVDDTFFDYLPEFGYSTTWAQRHNLVLKPVVEILAGLLFVGYCLLSAPPKVGKTRMYTQIALAIARGVDWLGQPTRQGPVLVFSMEDDFESVAKRERELAGEDYDPHADWPITVYNNACADELPLFQRLETLLAEGYGPDHTPYVLVILDTAMRFTGVGNEFQNAYQQGLTATAPLDKLGLKYRCAILGIHHDNQTKSKDPGQQVVGSSSIIGSSQCNMYLRRAYGADTGRLIVQPRGCGESEFALKFTEGAWYLGTGSPAAAGASGTPKAVLEALADHGPQTVATLRDLLPNEPFGSVKKALSIYRNKGQIEHNPTTREWSIAGSTRTRAISVPPPAPEPVAEAVTNDREAIRQRYLARKKVRPRVLAAPAQTPTVTVPLPASPAPTDYQRPSWAPEPLPRTKAGTPNVIPTFNLLLAESFRLKKVKLIAHAYAPGEVPTPLCNRPGKGMQVHEGSHTWINPDRGPDDELTVLDKPGAYLGILGSTEIPIGRLTHHEGTGPADEGQAHWAGIHRLDHWPTWSRTDLPHPGGNEPNEKEIWIPTPILKLLLQNKEFLSDFTVLESWTGRTTRLTQFQVELRDARAQAIVHNDSEFLEFLKAMYSKGISTAGESSHNQDLWRPDWVCILRSQANANMWRAAQRAVEAGLTVAAVRKTDELHLVGTPEVIWSAKRNGVPVFRQGTGLSEWKTKITEPADARG